MTDPSGTDWQPPTGRQPGQHQQPGQPPPGYPPPGYGPPPPVSGALPGHEQPPPGYGYGSPDPNQNWGLGPGAPSLTYETVVPRPPRPTAVALAVGLTYAGVALSGLEVLGSSIFEWQRQGDAETQFQRPGQPETADLVSSATGIGIGIGVGFWMIAAAGVVVCAVLAGRKKNPARIVLSSLMGVIALVQFCSGLSTMVTGPIFDTLAANNPELDGQVVIDIPWWQGAAPLALSVLAAAIAVLLILPSVNRYFSAGAGRRFAPDV